MRYDKLKFDIQKVAEHLRHSADSDTHRSVYGDESTVDAGIWWVKDNGTYLMSNGDFKTRPPVVYAKGLSDKADWDLVQAVCGGDDFVEYVSCAELGSMMCGALGAEIASGRKGYLVITPTAQSFTVTIELAQVRAKKGD